MNRGSTLAQPADEAAAPVPAAGRTPRRLPSALLVSALVMTALWLQLPFANGPHEWEWEYRPPHLEIGPGLLAVALLLPLLLLARGRSGALRLVGLTLTGGLLSVAVVSAQPGGMTRVFESLASRHTFSYVFDAGRFDDARQLVAAYPQGTATLSQHSRTHPPGPLLAIRGLDRIARSGAVGWLEKVLPDWHSAAGAAVEREVGRARTRRRPVPEPPPAATTVVLLALLLPLLSAAAAVPLYGWVRAEAGSPELGLAAAALWVVVPARTLFTPSLDQVLPVVLTASLWSARAGARGSSGIATAGLAGLLVAGATLLSYGSLAFAPFLLVALLAAGSSPRAERYRRLVCRGLAFVCGFLLPWVLLASLGLRPLRAFIGALEEHRAITAASRDYFTWLLYNPYDFALLLGPAILILALPGGLQIAAGGGWRRNWTGWCFWGVGLVLLLSGSVKGEVGRIWMLFMTLPCLLAGRTVAAGTGPASGRWLVAILVAQHLLLVTLAANMVFVV